MQTDRLDAALARLATDYPGPGGAVAVLRAGQVLARHAWGYANAERRIRFTPATLFRICSITKQFTCGAMLASGVEPASLDPLIAARLPRLEGAAPGALHLAHNQSGLRDYWAVAMLHGAPVEAPFGEAEAQAVIAGTSSLQFAPGTRFSYVNQNFRLLGDALEAVTGCGFAALLRRHLFGPAGMETALLAADTRALPDGTEGYEGSQAGGFRAAENRILWNGDAGIAASLEDMIAWERWIDATRDAPDGLYNRLSAPVGFADGAPAGYGFGLGRGTAFGRAITGHGGALRGWRSHRVHAAAERVSVVVLFNHLGDASAAAMAVLGALLGETPAPAPAALPPPAWLGTYLAAETGLAARVEGAGPGRVRLRFGHNPEVLALTPDGAGTDRIRLRPHPDGLLMERAGENLATLLRPAGGDAPRDIAGRYRCAELGAELAVEEAGGVPYGGFSGCLGQGRMELLEPLGPDLWALPCPRALDHTPPGDWTLAFSRDAAGRVDGAEVGCWLARNLRYDRLA